MPYSHIKYIIPEIQFCEPFFSKIHSNLFGKNNLNVSMLRLDEIHPVISGNKIFKLTLFLEEAKKSFCKRIITFGGAYSNHLAATAFAAKELKLKSVGIVRGEKPKVLSPTLQFCLQNEMQLEFVSRSEYKILTGIHADESSHSFLKNKYGEHVFIPEGGFSVKGKEGASFISGYFTDKNFTHVCVPVGTATTFAGLIESNKNDIQIIGFSVLKNPNDLDKRFEELQVDSQKVFSIIDEYHFGGYAKKNGELISFMNAFYKENKILLDFVYTAKMMFGVYDLIKKNYFHNGANILCIHTGGLQGNSSLPTQFYRACPSPSGEGLG